MQMSTLDRYGNYIDVDDAGPPGREFRSETDPKPKYKKQPVLPKKNKGRPSIKRAAIKQIVENLWTGPLSPKKTTVYRGQTATPMPELKGGDFKSKFDRHPGMKADSGKFWSQSTHSAKGHAKIVGRAGNTPVAVWKAEVPKVDVLKGQKSLLKHNRISNEYVGATDRGALSRAKADIRQGNLYQTVMDPPNKRLSISQTSRVNPTFKGVRGPALKSLAQVAMRVSSRILGPVGIIDMIVNPTPAYNPNDGYKGDDHPVSRKADPRRRMKATIAGIR